MQIVVKGGGAERLAGEFSLHNLHDAWGMYSTTFNIPIHESYLYDQVEVRIRPVLIAGDYQGAVHFDNVSIAACDTLDDAAVRNATGFIDASIQSTSFPTQSGPGGPSQQNQEYILEANVLDIFADQIDCWTLSMSTQPNGPFVDIDHVTGNHPQYIPEKGLVQCGMFYKISHSIITGCGRPLCATMVLYASCTEYDKECSNCDYYGTISDDLGGPQHPSKPGAVGEKRTGGTPFTSGNLFDLSPNPTRSTVMVRLTAFDPKG